MFKNSLYQNSGSLVNYWYAAGLSQQFKNGKPQCCIIMEIPLVLWRSSKGQVTALLDRCNHRNAPLSAGQIENDCLVCPYHGWTYNDMGQCVHIPSEGPHTERIPNQTVEQFPVKETNGIVWVWMGRSTPPDCEPFTMPYHQDKNWNSYYMETDFEQGVTDLVENFMDVPHTVFVHRGWFRERKQICINAITERKQASVEVAYDQPNDSIGMMSRLLNPKSLPLHHTDKFFMPNNTRVDYQFGSGERHFIIASTCTPVNSTKTKVYTLIAYNFGWFNSIARFFMPAYTRKVISQDVSIMRLQGENLRKFDYQRDFRSTQADTMHLYIESLRRWDEEGRQGQSPQPVSKQVEFWI